MPMAFSHLAGREVDTASETWRHECECLWLLTAKPGKSHKHLHLYGVPDREMLFDKNPRTGQPELSPNYTSRWLHKSPLMKARSLEAADRILADARRIHELTK